MGGSQRSSRQSAALRGDTCSAGSRKRSASRSSRERTACARSERTNANSCRPGRPAAAATASPFASRRRRAGLTSCQPNRTASGGASTKPEATTRVSTASRSCSSSQTYATPKAAATNSDTPRVDLPIARAAAPAAVARTAAPATCCRRRVRPGSRSTAGLISSQPASIGEAYVETATLRAIPAARSATSIAPSRISTARSISPRSIVSGGISWKRL